MAISPPNVGGQAMPHPDPQTLVEEVKPLLFTGSEDFTIFYSSKPVQPEIKVSTLDNSYFCLPDCKLFVDKALPDPSPRFLDRCVSHSRFDSDYFILKHTLAD